MNDPISQLTETAVKLSTKLDGSIIGPVIRTAIVIFEIVEYWRLKKTSQPPLKEALLAHLEEIKEYIVKG